MHKKISLDEDLIIKDFQEQGPRVKQEKKVKIDIACVRAQSSQAIDVT